MTSNNLLINPLIWEAYENELSIHIPQYLNILNRLPIIESKFVQNPHPNFLSDPELGLYKAGFFETEVQHELQKHHLSYIDVHSNYKNFPIKQVW